MSSLEKLKAAIKNFEETQNKYRQFGAHDTEPRGIFMDLLILAMDGQPRPAPRTVEGWDLYSEMKGNAVAARSLGAAADKCLKVIRGVKLSEAGPVRAYIQSYCW